MAMSITPEMLGLGGIMALVGAFLVFALIIGVAMYVYMALVLSTIAKKLKYRKPWLAWIPIANIALLPILAGYAWTWVFILLVPLVNIVFMFIWVWKIFEKRKYPGWLSLVPLLMVIPFVNFLVGIAQLVIWGMVAWSDRK